MSDTEPHPALAKAMQDRPRKQRDANIREHCEIEPEIYRDFFAPLLENSVFERWQHEKAFFHLRYVGGPGSGKTTFAAIAAESLRARYKTGEKDAVVSIFISARVKWDERVLVDVLESIFLQLCPTWAPEPSSVCLESYAYFLQSPSGNDELLAGLRDLRAAINCRVSELDRVFLIVDGLDHSRPEDALDFDKMDFETDLEKEFARLDSKVKILSTSRALNLEKDDFVRQWWPTGTVRCNGKGCSSPDKEMLKSSVYWACQEECAYTLCWLCYEQGDSCTKCNTQVNFRQTSNVCIAMDSILGPRVSQYIDREMQDQIHQANFGRLAPGKAGTKKMTENKKDYKFLSSTTISDMSGNNIAIARVRLEMTYFGRGNPVVDGGLPREVVTVFNSIVNATGDLGVRAIAAVDHLALDGDWVSLEKVIDVLQLAQDNACTRLLLAAKGLLIVRGSRSSPKLLWLGLYNSVFKRYVSDGYDERINAAKEDMRFDLERVAQEPEECFWQEDTGGDTDNSEYM